MQIENLYSPFFLLLIFAKLKQFLFHGWSLKPSHSPCDGVFIYAQFGHHMGLESDWLRQENGWTLRRVFYWE